MSAPAAQTPTCIAIIGAGHVGGPTAVMIAHKCPHLKVLVTDANPRKLAAWQSDKPPVYEPGLKEVLQIVRGTNLFFTPDLPSVVRQAQLIFVAVTTPLKSAGIGAGMAPDVRFWESVARQIGAVADEPKVVIERSTVPVRTARLMAQLLRPPVSKVRHEVLSNPSFFASGTALVDLASPDVVLIGGEDTPTGRAAVAALSSVYAHWVPMRNIKTSGVWSAELAKLTANAFLAQRIASMNAISAVCEASDAEVGEVAKAIGTDSRIGSKHLQAGIGFGGACYPTHLRNLVYLCRHHDLPEVASYWQAVLDMNTWQRERFTEEIVRTLFNTVAGKKIAVLGFAYKRDTSDIRETPAKYVCARLLDEGAELSIYDPQVSRTAIEQALGAAAGWQDVVIDDRPDVPTTPVSPGTAAARLLLAGSSAAAAEAARSAANAVKLSIESDAYLACAGAHALVVLTDWDEFKTLDYSRIYGTMKRPCFVFDGRCILDAPALRRIGFSVRAIGSAAHKVAAPPPPPPASAADLKIALQVSGPLDY